MKQPGNTAKATPSHCVGLLTDTDEAVLSTLVLWGLLPAVCQRLLLSLDGLHTQMHTYLYLCPCHCHHIRHPEVNPLAGLLGDKPVKFIVEWKNGAYKEERVKVEKVQVQVKVKQHGKEEG